VNRPRALLPKRYLTSENAHPLALPPHPFGPAGVAAVLESYRVSEKLRELGEAISDDYPRTLDEIDDWECELAEIMLEEAYAVLGGKGRFRIAPRAAGAHMVKQEEQHGKYRKTINEVDPKAYKLLERVLAGLLIEDTVHERFPDWRPYHYDGPEDWEATLSGWFYHTWRPAE